MTAEIAIMNKEAVALAADSAVTVGEGIKIYNTASKLFALSKYHPVGVMVYNNTQYIGMPWELMIKQNRERLKIQSFNHLRDHAAHFIDFLQDHTDLITARVKENHFREVISRYLAMIATFFLAAYQSVMAFVKHFSLSALHGRLCLIGRVPRARVENEVKGSFWTTC